MTNRPNLLLIICDQMRGDCYGAAGHPDVKTPYIDTIAAQGTRYTNAYSACPSCIAARAALLTGQSQRRHGRVGYQDGVTWNYPDTLPALLSRNGYHTEAIGKMHVHPPLNRCGFNNVTLHDGFVGYHRRPDVPYIDHQFAHDDYLRFLRGQHGPEADVTDTGIECNSWVAHPWCYDDMSHPTNWAASRALDFLHRRDRNVPFFLKLSFVRPHPPWDSPESYFDLYRDCDFRPPAMGDWAEQKDERIFDSYTAPADAELRRR
ncbi:MAG: sulfatase-like hydrolase/transferase, partial [Clostridia bacterium]|nr:sulfatase-like hydrolase/transferase [Clostridia bacterium]